MSRIPAPPGRARSPARPAVRRYAGVRRFESAPARYVPTRTRCSVPSQKDGQVLRAEDGFVHIDDTLGEAECVSLPPESVVALAADELRRTGVAPAPEQQER